MSSIDYKAAGVDVDAGMEAVNRIKKSVESTFSPHVLTPIGSFGAMYDLKPLMQTYQHPVLVQSIDGVGTKIMVAKMMQKFDTIGIDLVSATTNDIVVMGAKPLTLLDYIANDKLRPEIVEQIVKGIAVGCRENGISLIGGETAEMPGTYLSGEHDLVGVITGVVEKDKAILGHDITSGDIVAAFPSSGLHTNGYSLARKLLFDVAGFDVGSRFQDFSHTIGEELLLPHINYTRPILELLDKNIAIKGMAHITGGGLLENLPRILPAGCAIEIQKRQIPERPIFNLLRKLGNLDDHQMYRTFNMGAGLVLCFSPEEFSAIREVLRDFEAFPLYEIGRVVSGTREVKLL
ncbi:phosphoribosylformylglycinamidine cyclo ligase [Legionella lansingensis]|uniref:Phosphoribosylformylglycinamidine cyclo-ligase n=1 Tax=Legionella lansingensis TaxID=45067 RepID=A0A0W0VUN4_9GAMM|nr:phosphoribosylformylglycinamidine cyclo-ligase [Legionella lansingensis]KTD23743.1 phosphoribosylformylglycinamidine cyclo ligase [Legionella lansingensis]SNV47554.1 phosphoribosylformylglycinamidine cyclo ligase [Legionella lansingensis]